MEQFRKRRCPVPIRLNPRHSDPESDLETQLLAMGAILAGNLMTVAVLHNKLLRQRDPTWEPAVPRLYAALPKVSTGLFLAASLYFLALSHRDARQEPSSLPLAEIFFANLLSTASVGLKSGLVFAAPPESEATVGSVEP